MGPDLSMREELGRGAEGSRVKLTLNCEGCIGADQIEKGKSGHLGGRSNEYTGTGSPRAGHTQACKLCRMAAGESFAMINKWEGRMG